MQAHQLLVPGAHGRDIDGSGFQVAFALFQFEPLPLDLAPLGLRPGVAVGKVLLAFVALGQPCLDGRGRVPIQLLAPLLFRLRGLVGGFGIRFALLDGGQPGGEFLAQLSGRLFRGVELLLAVLNFAGCGLHRLLQAGDPVAPLLVLAEQLPPGLGQLLVDLVQFLLLGGQLGGAGVGLGLPVRQIDEDLFAFAALAIQLIPAAVPKDAVGLEFRGLRVELAAVLGQLRLLKIVARRMRSRSVSDRRYRQEADRLRRDGALDMDDQR